MSSKTNSPSSAISSLSRQLQAETDQERFDLELCAFNLIDALTVCRDFDYRSGFRANRQALDAIMDCVLEALPDLQALVDMIQAVQPVLITYENVFRILEGSAENAVGLKAFWSYVEGVVHQYGYSTHPEQWPGDVLPDELLDRYTALVGAEVEEDYA
jgi:hypothetical protein